MLSLYFGHQWPKAIQNNINYLRLSRSCQHTTSNPESRLNSWFVVLYTHSWNLIQWNIFHTNPHIDKVLYNQSVYQHKDCSILALSILIFWLYEHLVALYELVVNISRCCNNPQHTQSTTFDDGVFCAELTISFMIYTLAPVLSALVLLWFYSGVPVSSVHSQGVIQYIKYHTGMEKWYQPLILEWWDVCNEEPCNNQNSVILI